MDWIEGPYSMPFLLAVAAFSSVTSVSVSIWLTLPIYRAYFHRKQKLAGSRRKEISLEPDQDPETFRDRTGKIGKQLHDGPAQHLAYVLMRLDEVEDALKTVPGRNGALDTAGDIRDATKEALAHIRTLSATLQRSSGDHDDRQSVADQK